MNLKDKIINEVYDELAESFIELHKAQFVSSGLPEIHWKDLFMKLKEEIFDAGNYFQIRQRVNEDDECLGYKAVCINEKGLSRDDSAGVFLVDHAWTYHVNSAKESLKNCENLLDRLCNMMNINIVTETTEEEAREQKIEAVLNNMWKFNQTYKISTEKLTDEEREPIWYVMDEFGSSIRHSDEPTVKCAPFFYLPTSTMFSIIWPVQDLNFGDELTRDYAYNVKDEKLRKCKLLPWIEEYLDEIVEEETTVQQEPDIDYFKSSKEDELLPEIENLPEYRKSFDVPKSKYNVYTDLSAVKKYLTDKRFNLVDEPEKADIRFIYKHFKDYKMLYEKFPQCMINQFPFENVVTVKDLLAVVCRRVEDSKSWLPITYNMTYELSKFIAYYKEQEEKNLDNYWILKPWNLARSIDTTVTNNLNQIIRSHETGPKIICKYISNPVLYYRDEVKGNVKFDIRYIVLLRSIQPLQIFTYKVFWLRFANKTYSLDNFEEYEKHFTVMNYKEFNLKQVNYDEFIPEFERQNSDFKWDDIQNKIFKMIRQVFEGASKENPPKGIANNPQSRAMYAIDLMLDWREENGVKTMEPMICEVNFMPDCKRACQYHPTFFNDVFNKLFLNNNEHQNCIEV